MATGRTNRLALDENDPRQAGKDVDTGKFPVFTLAAPYTLSIGHIVDGVVTSIADWASVRLQVTSQCNRDGDRYIDQTVTSLNTGLTQQQWDGGASQHAVFSLAATDTNLALLPCDDGPLYYVLTVTRNDGQIVPLGYGTINVDRAHQSGSNLVVAPAGSNFPQLGLSLTTTVGPQGAQIIPQGPNQFQLALSLPLTSNDVIFGRTPGTIAQGSDTRVVGAIQHVGNMAAFRAMPVPDASVSGRVSLGGYYTDGDRPAVGYRWSATSTLPDDGGAVINPTGNGLPGRWLLDWDGLTADVRNWGTRADNVSDDLPFINAAIAALPNCPYDLPAQPPGAGATGTYKQGTLVIPEGNYRTSDTIYLSSRMAVILDGSITFLPGAAPSASAEKWVVRVLFGSNTVGNPNTTFGVSIRGHGGLSSGSPTDNPGGSCLYWAAANYGSELNGIIIGQYALHGISACVQGGSIRNVWCVGPGPGPALETVGICEQLVIDRCSLEHANPGAGFFPGTSYLYDSAGYPIPAVHISGARNVTITELQTEASPLSLLIENSQCVTVCSLYANASGAQAATNSGLVLIRGDSQNINLFGLNGPGLANYQVLDQSVSSGQSRPGTAIIGPAGRTSYVQDSFADTLSVRLLTVPTINGPLSVTGALNSTDQLYSTGLTMGGGNASGYGLRTNGYAANPVDRVNPTDPDGRFRFQLSSMWNGNPTIYGEWTYVGIGINKTGPTCALDVVGDAKVSGAVTAGALGMTSTALPTAGSANDGKFHFDGVHFYGGISGAWHQLALAT